MRRLSCGALGGILRRLADRSRPAVGAIVRRRGPAAAPGRGRARHPDRGERPSPIYGTGWRTAGNSGTLARRGGEPEPDPAGRGTHGTRQFLGVAGDGAGGRIRVLAAYQDGVTAICGLADRFTGSMWHARTPCPEWRASDLAGHLRCIADDYHEYLDDAPASRYARLLAPRPPSADHRQEAGPAERGRAGRAVRRPAGRAHRGVRRRRPRLRGPAAVGLGPAPPPVPRPGGDGGRDGGRGRRRVPPARLGPVPRARPGPPPGPARGGAGGLAGRHAAPAGGCRGRLARLRPAPRSVVHGAARVRLAAVLAGRLPAWADRGQDRRARRIR